MNHPGSVGLTQPYRYDRRWYSDALRQIAQARWRREPLIIITGPAGAGKTTLCRQVADRKSTRTFVVLITAPPTANELLKELACELGVLSKAAAAATTIGNEELQRAVQHAIAGLAALSADCLIIVDDAHRLEPEGLAEIRALVSAGNQRRPSLQVILVGQPVEATERPVAAAGRPTTVPRPVLAPQPVDPVPVDPPAPTSIPSDLPPLRDPVLDAVLAIEALVASTE